MIMTYDREHCLEASDKNMFIEKDADVNTKDCLQWTPLINAVYHGHLSTIKILLDLKADPDLRDM